MDWCKSAELSGDFPAIAHGLWNISTKYGTFADYAAPDFGYPVREVKHMNDKRHQQRLCMDLRLDPESRLCPAFDCTSIKLFAAPDEGEMGFRVLDNCAEENMR